MRMSAKNRTFLNKLMKNKIILIALFVLFWIAVYFNLDTAAKYFVFELLGMEQNSRLTDSVRFFFYEAPKVILLLIIVVFAVGIIRSFFSPEKTRKILGGKSLFAGNILASLLGIVTPFCSCSAIPLFLGFVETGIPLGVTFSFLIAAPMINEIAVVLLFGLFGWKTALIYVATGLTIAILSGYVIGRLKLEKYVENWVFQVKANKHVNSDYRLELADRIDAGINAVKEIVSKVWLYIIIGIAVGAGIHGYVPENFMVSLMGKSAWWSVPVSVLIGVPMYSNAAGIIPVVQVLLEKGASLGTVLAFMMSVIGLSLPEIIILKKVLKIQLILAFIGVVSVGIIIVGYIFNVIY